MSIHILASLRHTSASIFKTRRLLLYNVANAIKYIHQDVVPIRIAITIK